MGHNLGMSHDFYTAKTACRNADDGEMTWCNQCSNWDEDGRLLTYEFGNPGECCTGFMDYGNHPEHWSNCSVRMFEQHYVSENWAACMPEGSFIALI